MTPPDLNSLLRRVAHHDPEAYSALYDIAAPMVYGLAIRTLKNAKLAEDVVQEVFLQIWTQAERFDPDKGQARSWIATLAHRRAVDTVRRTERARARELAAVPDTHEPDIADTVVNAERGQWVRQALDTLSDLQRQTIDLAYYGGLTQSQIADRLDVPLGTVKTRMRDGLIRLRSALEQQDA